MDHLLNHDHHLSTDDVLMGEILISLKRNAVVQSDLHTSAPADTSRPSYRSKVDLTVQMPPRSESDASSAMASPSSSSLLFRAFGSTVSPVASGAYSSSGLAPSHSPSERTKRYGPVVQLDDLRKCFNMPIAAVARKFGICATLLKKICRRHGIQRWPHRQIRSLQKSIDMLRESLAVAKGSNKEYIAKKIAAFEYTLECIMQDPNTAAKGISAGRLASPAASSPTTTSAAAANKGRGERKTALASSSALAAALSEDDDMEDEDSDRPSSPTPRRQVWSPSSEERGVSMSLKSILC
ncbi:Nlp7 protein [Globisporangium polare]